MTFDEFVTLVASAKRPDWRKGQTYFNYLTVFDPSLSKKVSMTENDPFYDDSRLPAFLQWVGENWNAQAEHMESAKNSSWGYLLKFL
jgi:hypothetical protein